MASTKWAHGVAWQRQRRGVKAAAKRKSGSSNRGKQNGGGGDNITF